MTHRTKFAYTNSLYPKLELIWSNFDVKAKNVTMAFHKTL